MEHVKDQSGGSASARASKLRYPLRSADKSKDEKPGKAEVPPAASSRRGRIASNVSKSVSTLELSAKEKSSKQPRRLSIPPKPATSPPRRFASSITPIAESRLGKKTISSQDKSETPKSDVSLSGSRRKFSVISSVSYWLSQIKLSESTSKHSISLGFFKLALESGCEPVQRLREELKSYVRRYNLLELGEPTKELLKSYDIGEDLGQPHVSETFCMGPNSSDEDSHVIATSGIGNLKPKCLNIEDIPPATVSETASKEAAHKKTPAASSRDFVHRSPVNLAYGNDNSQYVPKKSPKPARGQDNRREKGKRHSEKKPAVIEDSADLVPIEENEQEDKENMVVSEIKEVEV